MHSIDVCIVLGGRKDEGDITTARTFFAQLSDAMRFLMKSDGCEARLSRDRSR